MTEPIVSDFLAIRTSSSLAESLLLHDCENLSQSVGVQCRFLRMCPGLSRQIIGDLLGENNERCLRVLECFTASFDFTGNCMHYSTA